MQKYQCEGGTATGLALISVAQTENGYQTQSFLTTASLWGDILLLLIGSGSIERRDTEDIDYAPASEVQKREPGLNGPPVAVYHLQNLQKNCLKVLKIFTGDTLH